MNITQMLRKYVQIDAEILRLRKEIVTICEDKYQLQAKSAVSGSGSKGSAASDGGICDAIVSCEQHIKWRQKRIDELFEIKKKIDMCYYRLPAEEQEIVTLRYFEGREWPEISARVGISIKWLYRKATDIKNKVAQMYNNYI